MSRILFVDDDFERHLKFHQDAELWGLDVRHATNPGAALDALREESFDEIWLDYDAGSDGEGKYLSFKPVYQWLLDVPQFQAKIRIHSWNVVAADRWEKCLKEFGYTVVCMPFNYHEERT